MIVEQYGEMYITDNNMINLVSKLDLFGKKKLAEKLL